MEKKKTLVLISAAAVLVVAIALVAIQFVFKTPIYGGPYHRVVVEREEKTLVDVIKERGYLVVGTSADFPPFEFVAENGTIMGFDIDIAKEIAKKLGVELKVVDMDFDALIPALQDGKIDLIIAGMSITEERKKVVDFSEPYFEADQAILVRADSEIASLDDLKGKKVGVQSGTTGEDWAVTNLVEAGITSEENLYSYDKFIAAVEALRIGHLDAVVMDAPVAKTFVKKYPELKIAFIVKTGEVYGIAVRKGEAELLDLINEVLKELKETGKLDKLVEKWFGG